MSDLKLRYNYGRTGSVEGIDNYERFATIKTGTTIFGVNPGTHTSLWVDGMRSAERTWGKLLTANDVGSGFLLFLSNRFERFI